MKGKEILNKWHTFGIFCKRVLLRLRGLKIAFSSPFAFTHQCPFECAKILMVNYRHSAFRAPSILSASSHCPEGNSRLRASSCTVSCAIAVRSAGLPGTRGRWCSSAKKSPIRLAFSLAGGVSQASCSRSHTICSAWGEGCAISSA